LINGILDVSKIQAGKLAVDLESVSISSILQSCLLIVEAKAREKDVLVETHVMPNLPDLMADPLRLKQILINLLSNAVKFTPAKGRIRIDVGIREKNFASISISDTGLGMSMAEIETAMSPFGQVDAGFNKRHEGTGLGLPIAYALARLHGGDLQIESKKGAGTRVTVSLPMAAPAANDHSLH
jgi:two-component system cell cycle sensor histidine kinase PleC